MKRELATYCLQLGDHQVFVDAGSRAEAHWVGLGYAAPGSSIPSPDQPPAVALAVEVVDTSEVKPKRRGRKPAVAADAGVTGDE